MALLALAGPLWGLGGSPISGTEGHRALTAHQMVSSGEWIVPHLYGAVYLAKPPMQYWLLALLETTLGASGPALWRSVSVAASVFTAVLLWQAARNALGRAAGLAAGCAFVAMLPMWEQNRSADIDALNCLAATGLLLAVLRMVFDQPQRTARLWLIACGWAAVMWMTKGPTGLPAVVGGVAGAAVAMRRCRALASWRWWTPVLVGALPLALWLWAVSDVSSAAKGNVGTAELASKLFSPSVERLLRAAAMPVTLFLYALPVTLAIPLLLVRGFHRPDFEAPASVRLHLGAAIGGMIACAPALMAEPRYGYVALPATALAVGGLAHLWHRGGLTVAGVEAAARCLGVAAVVYFVAQVALLVMTYRAEPQQLAMLLLIAALGLAAMVGALTDLTRRRFGRAVRWCLALVLLASVSLSLMVHAENRAHPGLRTAELLRKRVGRSELLVADLAANHPATLYYAKANVTRVDRRLSRALAERSPQSWAALSGREWDQLDEELRRGFVEVLPLPHPKGGRLVR